MPQTKQYTIYKYDELTPEAQEKARDWYRQGSLHDEWWDGVYEQSVTAAKALGIEIDTKNKGRSPAIYFSGFSNQGDGAKFEGRYAYKKGWRSALLHEFGPGDNLNELLGIGEQLRKAQAPHFYKLTARCTDGGHYQHSGCMGVHVEHDEDRYRDIGDSEDGVQQALREFADWIYSSLEKEHDWLQADEQVTEAIQANEYTFDEHGNRED